MPFGFDCEFETFDACVAQQRELGRSESSARRICGALQKDTEEKCAWRKHEPSRSLNLMMQPLPYPPVKD